MGQWFGFSANAALRRSKVINQGVNYETIDSNVMDWANITKYIPPICQMFFFP